MYKIFLYVMLLAPISFGANRPWAWSIYALLLALFGLVACVGVLLNRVEIPFSIQPVKYPFYLICAPIAWSFFQLSNFAPDSWIHPFWLLAGEQLPGSTDAHISLAPQQTGTALMKLGSYLLVFFISLQFNRDSENAALTFKSIAYAGLIYAIYGLIMFLGQYHMVLWFDKWTYRESVTSTFINRNSYATYAGLTLLSSFPLLFEKIQSCLHYGIKSNYGKQYFFENALVRFGFPLLLIMVITTALFLSLSRGGFLSTLVAVLTLFFVLLLSRKIRNNATIMILITVISAVSLGTLAQSGGQLIDRLGSISSENQDRWRVYDLLVKANSENRWLGVGYGSFESSFRLYRDETVLSNYDKAHNTYLENIFELGLLQASALFAAIFWTALTCLRGVWIRRKHWFYPAVGFSATILVGAHALVDFSLQIPAVAFTYALIMGAAVGQASSSRKNRTTNTHSFR